MSPLCNGALLHHFRLNPLLPDRFLRKEDLTGKSRVHKTIPIADAVGMVLPHDVTEIRQGEFKGRAFRKGHIIRPEDIEHLKRLGKENIYILELAADDIHENEAAVLMATALAGSGVEVVGEPIEGKLNLVAGRDGLLRVDRQALYRFNLLGEVMCATLHSETLVSKGQQVAATRLIPLVGRRLIVEEAVAIAGVRSSTAQPAIANAMTVSSEMAASAIAGSRITGMASSEIAKSEVAKPGIIRVDALRKAKSGLVITGNEVYHGRVKDAFEPVLRQKLAAIGSEVVRALKAPDNTEKIAAAIGDCLSAGADLIITSGGMSVDPDDVTRAGIALAGAVDLTYGTPALPGAMFMVGYIPQDHGLDVPILGLPACGMFHRITVFDLTLPRILAGEKIDRSSFAAMGHGGLCMNCKNCLYPVCPFGKR